MSIFDEVVDALESVPDTTQTAKLVIEALLVTQTFTEIVREIKNQAKLRRDNAKLMNDQSEYRRWRDMHKLLVDAELDVEDVEVETSN